MEKVYIFKSLNGKILFQEESSSFTNVLNKASKELQISIENLHLFPENDNTLIVLNNSIKPCPVFDWTNWLCEKEILYVKLDRIKNFTYTFPPALEDFEVYSITPECCKSFMVGKYIKMQNEDGSIEKTLVDFVNFEHPCTDESPILESTNRFGQLELIHSLLIFHDSNAYLFSFQNNLKSYYLLSVNLMKGLKNYQGNIRLELLNTISNDSPWENANGKLNVNGLGGCIIYQCYFE